jgi:hypothetical protein
VSALFTRGWGSNGVSLFTLGWVSEMAEAPPETDGGSGGARRGQRQNRLSRETTTKLTGTDRQGIILVLSEAFMRFFR